MDQQPAATPPALAPAPKNSNTLKIIGALVIIIVVAFSTWEFALKNKSQEGAMAPEPTTVQTAPIGEQTTTLPFRDGTYEATGQYQNPASQEEVDVTITLVDGKVTAAKFSGTPDNPTTTLMQGKFNDGFEELVVGQPVDQIALTVVNGSSLAPKGFMDALNKIKAEAQAQS